MTDDGRCGTGLVTFGETMGLVTAGQIGPLEFAGTFTLGIGGAESNVAIGVARLGSPVTWFGRIGSDATGDLIERRLSAERITTLAIRDTAFTGLMVKHRRSGTTWRVDYHRAGSAGSRLCPDDVPVEAVRAATILHLTGITPALSDSARDATRHAVTLARDAGTVVSMDVNYRGKLWDPRTAEPVLRDLVSRADIVFAGPAEARLVLGPHAPESTPDLVRALADLGPAETVVKDGARGCVALVDGVQHALPALAVDVVDPVGAGDAFVAGYLAERLDGNGPARRLATAIAAGAFAVTVPGDCEGLPRRADLAAVAGTDDVAR